MTDVLTVTTLRDWLQRFAQNITAEADWLTELDSAIGDADHGTNMVRGTAAVLTKLESSSQDTVQELFKTIGMTLVSTVGGASGSLYGTLFLEMGRNAPTTGQLEGSELGHVLRAGVAGVVSRGHAAIGDKTMIDALEPATSALTASLSDGEGLCASLATAAAAASKGRDSTKNLVAKKGRASYLGERSAGHIDPGAASAAILLAALAAAVPAGEHP